MNPRRNRLLTAIKSAQNHVQSSNVSQLDDKLDSNKTQNGSIIGCFFCAKA